MYTNIGIDLTAKEISIIGGGAVALRRAKRLEDSMAKIHVISPSFHPGFTDLKVNCIEDTYKKSYIENSFLVVIATNDDKVNNQVRKDCEELGILYNSAYDSNQSDIIFPSQVFKGLLNISVSTSGKYPALSKYLREDMEERYSRFTDEYINELAEIRSIILSKSFTNEKELLYKALDMDINELKKYKEKLINTNEDNYRK